MHIGKYIDLVHRSELDLVKAFRLVADAHGDEVDVYQTCMLLSSWSQRLADNVQVFAEKYGEENDDEPDRLTQTLLKETRQGGMALLRDEISSPTNFDSSRIAPLGFLLNYSW
jgi:hypothetical protein